MSDEHLNRHIECIIEKNKTCLAKAGRIETKILNKENKALGIAALFGLLMYIIPKLIEMVI